MDTHNQSFANHSYLITHRANDWKIGILIQHCLWDIYIFSPIH